MEEPILIMNKAYIVAQPMTASINSGIIDLVDVRNYMMQYVISGTPIGTINVLISNDGINFDPIGTAVSISAAGSGHIKDSAIGYRYIQVAYAFTSGSGVLTATVCGKQ